MSRDTRIGLLVGLAFIILFGLVLSLLNDSSTDPAPPVAMGEQTPTPWPPLRTVARPEVQEYAADASAASESRLTVQLSREPAGERQETVRLFASHAQQATSDAPLPTVPNSRPAPQASSSHTSPEPAEARVRTYTVQSNDSLYGIAQNVYGDGNQYRRIYEANRDRLPNENTLRVGQELVIPDLEPAAPQQQRRRETAPPLYQELDAEDLPEYFARVESSQQQSRTYVVQPNDNLTSIARRLLNDGSRDAVQRLYRANRTRLRSPDVLPVGVELVIPS